MEANEGLSKKKRILNYLLKDAAMFGGIALIAVALNLIFGHSCPTRLILRFECPFCGMTRAHLAALRFDFAAAMAHHSLFFLGLPYIYLITHDELFKGKLKPPYVATVIIMTVLFLLRYLVIIIDKI